MFIDHYAKGAWYLAAALVEAGARLEQAKAFNFVLDMAAALVCFAAVVRVFRTSIVRAVMVALLAAANPVIVCQLFNFYLDGQLGSALTAFMAAGALSVSAPEPAAWAALCAAVVVAVNVKFTGLVYVVALTVGLGVSGLLLRGGRRVLAVSACSVLAIILAALVVGWSPYVTNARSNGHPFYPLAGTGAIDVVTWQAPQAAFAKKGAFEQLFTSLFSTSASGLPGAVSIKSKIPFTVSRHEPGVFVAPDVRVGGFGPLFGAALLVAGVLAAALIAFSLRAAAICLSVAIALLASVLLMPAAWWARYVPQLWLVPIAIALAPAPSKYRFVSRLQFLLFAVLAADATMVLAGSLGGKVRGELAVREELRGLQGLPSGIEARIGRMEGARFRLANAGVPSRVVPALHCASPRQIAATDASWCPVESVELGRIVQRDVERARAYPTKRAASRIP